MSALSRARAAWRGWSAWCQIEPGQQLFGEGEFVVGRGRVGEGESERTLCLAGGAFAGDSVMVGFVAGGGADHVAVGPPDVAVDVMVASCPAQSGCARLDVTERLMEVFDGPALLRSGVVKRGGPVLVQPVVFSLLWCGELAADLAPGGRLWTASTPGCKPVG